eukprot:694713-Rhodomonas_salina.2
MVDNRAEYGGGAYTECPVAPAACSRDLEVRAGVPPLADHHLDRMLQRSGNVGTLYGHDLVPALVPT